MAAALDQVGKDAPVELARPQHGVVPIPGQMHGQRRAHRPRAEQRDPSHAGRIADRSRSPAIESSRRAWRVQAPERKGRVAGSDNSQVSVRNATLLALAVVAVSFSAILIREAHAPAITIALYRNAIAAAMVLPVALVRRRAEIRSLTRTQLGIAVGSGALLAFHFATWIASLSYTTIA